LPEVTLNISSLIPTQEKIDGHVDNTDPILVVRRFGQNFVIDGHHRMYTAKKKHKSKTIQATVLDLPPEHIDLDWFKKKLKNNHLRKTSEHGYGF